jgi:hypothetical protein
MQFRRYHLYTRIIWCVCVRRGFIFENVPPITANRTRRPSKSLKTPFFDRRCIFFPPQNPRIAMSLLLLSSLSSLSSRRWRPSAFRRTTSTSRVAGTWNNTTKKTPTHTHTHTHINMYKCVYAHKTTLSVCRRVVKQSHPAVCEGPFPGPKTPNNGFYTCKPQNKFRFRPPFVHCIIILLYCIRQWRLHSARFRPCLCIMRPMLQ